MATLASVLSILIDANTGSATAKLTQFDKQLEATRAKTRQALEAKLGANFNPAAFEKYDQALSRTQRRIADKAAFKAALGGNFNPAGFRAYQRELDRSQTVTESSSGKMRKSVQGINTPIRSVTRSLGGLAKAAIFAGGAFAAFYAAKTAVKDTLELAFATQRLMAITGMDAQTASKWIEIMKVRGVQTRAVNMGFITLSHNLKSAEDGSKKAAETFKELGVSQQTIRSGNVNDAIMQIADGLQRIPNPARRAALAQQLFGRNAQALIPILAHGRRGLGEALGAAQRYGAFLPKNVAGLQRAHEAQLGLNLAMDGLRIAFTESVLPYLLKGANMLMTFIAQVRNGKGVGGQFASAISTGFRTAKDAIGGFIRLVGGVHNFVVVLQALFVAFLAFKAVGAIMSAVQLAMNPMFLIVAGLAAAAFLIVKNWGTIGPFLQNLWTNIKATAEPIIQWLTNVWGIVVNAFRIAWTHISTFFSGIARQLTATFGPTITAVIKGVQSLIAPASQAADVLRGILAPAFDGVAAVINHFFIPVFRAMLRVVGPVMAAAARIVTGALTVVGDLFVGAWHTVQMVMRGIANVVRGVFQILRGLLEVFAGVFTGNFGKIWRGIKDIFGGALKAIVGIVTGMFGAFTAVGSGLMHAFLDGIKAVWGAIKGVVGAIITSILGLLNGAFSAFYDAGKFLINGIASGIKAVVGSVLSVIIGFLNAIISVLDVVLDPIGAHIGKVSVPKFAQGGQMSQGAAAGAFITKPMAIVGEQAPGHPEYVLATNPAYRARNLKLWAQAGHDLGVPGFALGGIVGDILSGAGSIAKFGLKLAAKTLIPGPIQDLLNLGTGFAEKKLIGMLPGIPGVPKPFNNLPKVVLGKVIDWIHHSLSKLFDSATGGGSLAALIPGGVAAPAMVRAWIGQAMSIVGVAGAGWMSMLLRQAFRESGFNPKAINLTDINAQRGDPSRGLLQTTGSTFAAYMLPGHGNIWNPVDNTIAAIRYIIARYGGGNAAQALAVMIARGGGAYAQGGVIVPGNGTGDKVHMHALVEPGERIFVLNRNATAAMSGLSTLNDAVPRFQGGGFVPGAGVLAHQRQHAGHWATGHTTAARHAGRHRRWLPGVPIMDSESWRQTLLGLPALPTLHGSVPTTPTGARHLAGTISGLRHQLSALDHEYGTLDSFWSLNTTTDTPTRLGQLDKLIAIRQQMFDLWSMVVVFTSRLAQSNALIVAHLKHALAGISTKGLKGKALGAAQKRQRDLRSSIAKYTGNRTSTLGNLMSAFDSRDTAWVDLAQIKTDRATLAAGGGTPTGTTDVVGLLTGLLQQANLRTSVSEAQFKVLANFNWPPFGGSFAQGGIVPGPAGMPRTVIAHGGERIGSNATLDVRVVMEDHRTRVFVDDVEQAVEKVMRPTIRHGRRRLPGST